MLSGSGIGGMGPTIGVGSDPFLGGSFGGLPDFGIGGLGGALGILSGRNFNVNIGDASNLGLLNAVSLLVNRNLTGQGVNFENLSPQDQALLEQIRANVQQQVEQGTITPPAPVPAPAPAPPVPSVPAPVAPPVYTPPPPTPAPPAPLPVEIPPPPMQEPNIPAPVLPAPPAPPPQGQSPAADTPAPSGGVSGGPPAGNVGSDVPANDGIEPGGPFPTINDLLGWLLPGRNNGDTGADTMGGFNVGEFIQGATQGIGNFVGSQLGQGLLGLGQAGLGYLGQQEQADLARELAAQAQFKPYNIRGPLGEVTVQGQEIGITPTQQQAALQQQLFGLTGGALGRAQDPALMNIFQQAPGQLQQLTQQFIGQETAIPGAAQALQQQLGALGGEALGMGRGLLGQAQNLPSAMGAVSPLVGGAPLARSPEEALTSQAAGAGLGLLGEGAAGARGLTGTLAGTGGELLRGAAGGAPSFNQLASERLASLRASARPAEERTTQAALERLYGQGRLGTTGGQRALGELARAQEEADIARTIAAQNFAQQQQNVLANQAIQRGQLGLSALGGALGGQQFLTGTGTNLLGMGTQVGQFGRTLQEQARGTDINTLLAATGQDVAARMGQAGLGQGLFGLGAQLHSTIFGAQQAADQARLARGAQRIATAEGLFGFGQAARAGELGMGLEAMQAQQAQFNPLIQLANIASGMGSAQASGAANAADLRYAGFNSPYAAASTYLGSLINRPTA
jgi:hypothetical protein